MLSFALALLLAVRPVWAEPGPVSNWLMGTPASLFSFGLFRYNETMRQIVNPENSFAFAEYDWDANRIRATIYQPDATVANERACSKVIDNWRVRGGVSAQTDKKYYRGAVNSTYADLFAPIDYIIKSAPKDWRSKLDQIFEIEVTLLGGGRSITCTASLLGKGYSVSK